MDPQILQPIKNILVMWSGGIDSTYVLAKLLKDTKHQVHAHHICLVNPEHRDRAETEAIKKLMPRLQAIREFTYSETLIDHTRCPGFAYDMAIVCFEAGIVAKGFAQKDLKKIDLWTIGTHEAEGHWQERFDVISQATRAATWPYDAPKFYLDVLVSKVEEMQYLDVRGILGDCWYCRTPNQGKPCGTCKTCKEVNGTNYKEILIGGKNG